MNEEQKVKMKLSVIILAYNHQNYIEKCIDSILRQKTDFPFEILIADDCSTDDTINVVKKSFGDKVHFLERKHNLGLCLNMYTALKEATGEYAYCCSGDDYLPVDYVFQKHIDFLEKHSEYYSVFNHRKTVQIETGEEAIVQCPYEEYSLLDFLRGEPVHFYIGTIRNTFKEDDPYFFCEADRSNEEIQSIYYTLSKGKKAIIQEPLYVYCYRTNAHNYCSTHSDLDILKGYAKGFHAVERADQGKHKFDVAKVWYYERYIEKILRTRSIRMILGIFPALGVRDTLSFGWIKILKKFNHHRMPEFLVKKERLMKWK